MTYFFPCEISDQYKMSELTDECNYQTLFPFERYKNKTTDEIVKERYASSAPKRRRRLPQLCSKCRRKGHNKRSCKDI